MAQLREFSQGKQEAYCIDPRNIVIRPGWNYRDTTSPEARKHIEWLKGSIKQRGVDEAVWIENDGQNFLLVDGECRVIALRELWDEGVIVTYKDGTQGPPLCPTISIKGDEAAMIAKSLVLNGGLPPTQIEFGKAAERLLALGYGSDQVAALTPPHLGLTGAKAKRYVRDAVDLQQAPIAVKKAVADGKVSPALALSVTKQNRMEAPAIIERAAEEAEAAGKSQAKRPKGAGPVTKAKEAKEAKVQTIEAVGDDIADMILTSAPDRDALEKLAGQWNKLRGR
jgi:hypothetical protein